VPTRKPFNNSDTLPALTIAPIFKYQCQMRLIIKRIKENLPIKVYCDRCEYATRNSQRPLGSRARRKRAAPGGEPLPGVKGSPCDGSRETPIIPALACQALRRPC
jgi:hypothetical protein